MVELPHAVVGAAIALKLGNPALVVPLAIASHFVLDPIPHWNPHLYTEMKKKGKVSNASKAFIAGDVLLSLIFGFFIASLALPDMKLFMIVLLGAFCAVLPDLVKSPFYLLGIKTPLIKKYVEAERSVQGNSSPFVGIITQLLVITAALWWIFN